MRTGVVLTILVVFGLAGYLALTQSALPAIAASAVAFVLVAPTLSPLFDRRRALARVRPVYWLMLLAAVQLSYLLLQPVMFGQSTIIILTSMVLLAGVPLAASQMMPFSVLWGCTILAMIWIPFDHRISTGFWSWPQDQLGYPFAAFLAMSTTLMVFAKERPIRALTRDLPLRLGQKSLNQVLIGFTLLCLILLPISFGTGFVSVVRLPTWYQPIVLFVGIFFTIALPEELIFRGVLQNLLSEKLPSLQAVALSATMFGLTHWNNGSVEWDWRYLLLATIAGFGYGIAYRQTGRLLVPALIHTLVDTAWVCFFK